MDKLTQERVLRLAGMSRADGKAYHDCLTISCALGIKQRDVAKFLLVRTRGTRESANGVVLQASGANK